ncbi:MAG: DUF2156 domain-containing protein [Gemmatimonadaceae bacterium]|nr:DUF2156 domain-containing protein [Gemmatimonadaceae bacterium]
MCAKRILLGRFDADYLAHQPIALVRHAGTPVAWGHAESYAHFSLGMAPLSGLESRALAPLWNRAGAFVFKFGEHFYNFRGLRQYKDKFDPIWEPRYLASPGDWRCREFLPMWPR